MNPNQYLVPAKFVFLMAQVALLFLLIMTKEQHIYASIGKKVNKSSNDYKEENTIFNIYLIISLILCFVQLLFIVLSITINANKSNAVQSILYGIGFVMYGWFILEEWSSQYLLFFTVIFNLIPLILEIISLIVNQSFQSRIKIKAN